MCKVYVLLGLFALVCAVIAAPAADDVETPEVIVPAADIPVVNGSDCDPDGNNQPNCAGVAGTKNYRNFWDPTRYWQCKDGQLQIVLCKQQAYLTSADKCVNWNQWSWTPVCGDN